MNGVLISQVKTMNGVLISHIQNMNWVLISFLLSSLKKDSMNKTSQKHYRCAHFTPAVIINYNSSWSSRPWKTFGFLLGLSATKTTTTKSTSVDPPPPPWLSFFSQPCHPLLPASSLWGPRCPPPADQQMCQLVLWRYFAMLQFPQNQIANNFIFTPPVMRQPCQLAGRYTLITNSGNDHWT